MNPYRSRNSGLTVNRIAVGFVVLIALGAIAASVMLGPKPNATVVLMQPIRPAQTASAPSGAQTTAPSSDPVASLPAEQLPVIESRPSKAVTTEPKAIEQSELGIEVPPSAATIAPMTDGSSATSANQTSNASNPAQTLGLQTVPPSNTQPTTTSSPPTETFEPATVVPTVSNPQSTAVPGATRRSSSLTEPLKKPDAAASSAVASSPASSSTVSSSTAKAEPAAPTRAFLRRATNGVSVQVVALSNLESAARLAQNLAANGFTANVQPNGKIFRVVIGPYPTDAAAQTAAARASAFVR